MYIYCIKFLHEMSAGWLTIWVVKNQTDHFAKKNWKSEPFSDRKKSQQWPLTTLEIDFTVLINCTLQIRDTLCRMLQIPLCFTKGENEKWKMMWLAKKAPVVFHLSKGPSTRNFVAWPHTVWQVWLVVSFRWIQWKLKVFLSFSERH